MTETTEPDNFDNPWTEVLQAYLPQALEFFFPKVYAVVDWTRPYEFLGKKEFDEQMVRDPRDCRGFIDNLVKFWSTTGEEVCLLIHVEIEFQRGKYLPKRILDYNIRAFNRFDLPTINLVILCDDARKWRPRRYRHDFLGTRLELEFGSVKISHYQKLLAELEASDNFFALLVLAYLKTLETSEKLEERKVWKLSLISRLYDLGLQEQDFRILYRFIDWVMVLPNALDDEFLQEFRQFERERSLASSI